MDRALALLPYAAALALQRQRRFVAFGMPPLAAWRAVLSKSMRHTLNGSNLELLPSHLRHKSLQVVDVGANRGDWIAALLRFGLVQRAEIFEPLPNYVGRLRARFAAYPNVTIHSVAVGAQAGTAKLNVTATTTLSSMLPLTSALVDAYRSQQVEGCLEITERVEVPVVTLDETLPDGMPIDILKIDVQGFERQVIAGAVRTLERTKAVLIETVYQTHYEGDTLFPELWQLLTGHGFSFWSVGAPHGTPDGRAWWADSVFVKDV